MAEILLSLTIIGVVAAITLPSLTGNINERTWNTQRKALYARMSQAIALMPALNGYGTLTESESHSVTADTAAETFVTDGLSKVLKINNICDSEHLPDCGIPSKILSADGKDTILLDGIKTLVSFNEQFNFSREISDGTVWAASYSQTDTKAAAFETQNGESILVYYNPYCKSKLSLDTQYQKMYNNNYAQAFMCANFVYDMNGQKGPNTVGKDIGFMSVFYPSDSFVAAPVPTTYNSSVSMEWSGASNYCKSVDSDGRLPNLEELLSMFCNKNLLGSSIDVVHIWSGTRVVCKDANTGETKSCAWRMFFGGGNFSAWGTTDDGGNIWCVKR